MFKSRFKIKRVRLIFATEAAGFYKVLVKENGTTMTANPFRVASVLYATLTDQSDNPSGIVL